MKKIIFIFLIICAGKLLATSHRTSSVFYRADFGYKVAVSIEAERPNPFFLSFKKKSNKGKKAVAAILAFPLPFGVIGLHRIFLGTKPYVPLVYIGTIGGAFGILPFIDFCVLLLDKDIDHYKENPHIFMWIENQTKKDTLHDGK